MDDKDTRPAFGAGATVELRLAGRDPLPTATLLYIGTEGDMSSGLITWAYVIKHEDGTTLRCRPTLLKFTK